MTAARPPALVRPIPQQIAALALSALMTAGVLFSLAAQADQRHADALTIAQASQPAGHCAAPQRS